ncbi:MAG: hypothetical protein JXB00_11760 [Bacteroidales bacterium]|nr:hypothetical protein [Bacteroidales bacterium]
MKRILFFISTGIIALSCNNTPKSETADTKTPATEEQQVASGKEIEGVKPFTIESAYVKYRNLAAGQEMTREWWFDQFGNRQFEENYMLIGGEKTGGKALITDGFRYSWDYNAQTGTKNKYYQSVTDYDKVTQKEIERYGIAKHGHEEILGKKCLKVTIEKPAKSTVWLWNNIPLKTEAVFAGQKVLMEAVELVAGDVDPKLFEVPAGITFPETE